MRPLPLGCIINWLHYQLKQRYNFNCIELFKITVQKKLQLPFKDWFVERDWFVENFGGNCFSEVFKLLTIVIRHVICNRDVG